MREITKEQIIKDNTYKMSAMDYVKYIIIAILAIIVGAINIINFNSLGEMPDLVDTLFAFEELLSIKDKRVLTIIAIVFFICVAAYIIADNYSNFKFKSDIRKGKFTVTKCKVVDTRVENRYGMLTTYSMVLDSLDYTVETNNIIKTGTEVYIVTMYNGRILKPYFTEDYTLSFVNKTVYDGAEIK